MNSDAGTENEPLFVWTLGKKGCDYVGVCVGGCTSPCLVYTDLVYAVCVVRVSQ